MAEADVAMAEAEAAVELEAEANAFMLRAEAAVTWAEEEVRHAKAAVMQNPSLMPMYMSAQDTLQASLATLEAAQANIGPQAAQAHSGNIEQLLRHFARMVYLVYIAVLKRSTSTVSVSQKFMQLRRSYVGEPPLHWVGTNSGFQLTSGIPIDNFKRLAAAEGEGEQFKWKHRNAYLEYLTQEVGHQSHTWVSAKGTFLRKKFPGLRFTIRGKNDFVLVKDGHDIARGAVAAVEIKLDMMESLEKFLRQSESEFNLWSDTSLYKFVQVGTNFRVAVVYFSSNGGLQVVFCTWAKATELVRTLLNKGEADNFKLDKWEPLGGGGLPEAGGYLNSRTMSSMRLWQLAKEVLEE